MAQQSAIQLNVADKVVRAVNEHRMAQAIQFAWDSGVIAYVSESPKTLDEIQQHLKLPNDLLSPLLASLVHAAWIEQYGDDFAISSVARLIYHAELAGSADSQPFWSSFQSPIARAWMEPSEKLAEQYRCRESFRQWTLSAAAKQASAVLYGNIQHNLNRELLDLGAGASVFSAAFAFAMPELRVTSIDTVDLLQVAKKTIDSIEVHKRWTPQSEDYRRVDLLLNHFDDCLIVNLLKLEEDASAVILLGRCYDALKVGGRLFIIEPVIESELDPAQLALEELTMKMEGCPGSLRSTAHIQKLLTGAGFGEVQWGNLDGSLFPIALLVALKSA